MYIVTIDIDKCKGCGDCVDTCPVQGLVLEADGDRKIAVYTLSPDECLGCLACQEGCPEGSITITEL